MKNNKSLKVLSTAAIAAALVAPTVAVQPAFAATTYTVSGVQNAGPDSTLTETTRITVNLDPGTLTGEKTMQLRLPADSYAVLNGVKGGSGDFTTGGTAQVVSIPVEKGNSATPTADVVVTITGNHSEDVTLTGANAIVANDSKEDIAGKITNAINANSANYTAKKDGSKVVLTAKAAEVNDKALGLVVKTASGADFEFGSSSILVEGEEATNTKYIPDKVGGEANQVAGMTITPVNPNSNGAAQTFNIKVKPAAKASDISNKGVFYLDLTDLYIPSGAPSQFNAVIDSPDGTFTNGEIKIAQVGNGSVTTSIDGTVALAPGNNDKVTLRTIRVKEDSKGAFGENQEYKLELPDGFEWNSEPTTSVVWGDHDAELKKVTSNDKDTLVFKVVKKGTNNAYKTQSPTQFAIDGLKVKADDSDAEKGEVKVNIKGDVARTNTSIVIGTFGNYEGEVKGADAKTVYGGQAGEELANLTIKEDAPGTLQEGRVLKLKLNGNAKWATKRTGTGNSSKIELKEQPQIKVSDSDKNGLDIGTWELSGSDRTVIQATINRKSTNKPAKIVLEKLKVDVAPTAGKGEISVAVEGTTGVKTDSIVLGKTVAPVEISVDGELAKIDAGLQQQSIPNITIKEAAADLIDEKNLVVKFPDGVKPALPGKVEVTEGNLKIDSAKVSVEDNKIIIPVSKHSTNKGATIKLSDIKVTSYRYVPEGDLKVKITGEAVVQNIKDGESNDYPFNKPNDTHVVEGSVAKVVTPADKNKYAENIVFKIGSKTYTQDGKEMTMDVAPEVHPVYNRTYIPAAHFAASLNIPADKVVWNEASKTVTIFAGDKIVSATAGKKELVVNGTPVQIDAPVNYGQHTGYRVMVPYTHLALALGATVEWKADTQEIFVNKR